LKFAISTAFSPLGEVCPLAEAADRCGYDIIAVSDHVVHPHEIKSPYPYTPDGKPRWEPFTDWADPWVLIGAMAAVTKQINFTTNIFVLPMRNPFLAAKSVATASAISNGRVSLGIGVGWMEEEFDLLGQSFRRRGKRTDEMVEVMRKLWEGGWVEHHGEFYDFPPLEMSPAAPNVAIYCGGLSKRALRRAATLCDGWISDLHPIDEMGEIIAELKALRADSARADIPFTVLASSREAFGLDGHKRLADAGATHCMTFPWAHYHGDVATFEQKLESIERYAEDIMSHFD
jgi:probable F420-dependent oxidoreductase